MPDSARFRHIAIAGTGGISAILQHEFLALPNPPKLTVLSRSSSKPIPEGVMRHIVSYDSPDLLLPALKDVDVVVSTLNGIALGAPQQALIRAAVQAGVKLFVPSEFGPPTDVDDENMGLGGWTSPQRQMKRDAQALLKELGVGYLLVYSGAFYDIIYQPALGFDLSGGNMNIVGEGNTPISFTTRKDTARFLSHVLTALEPSTLLGLPDHTLRLEAARASLITVRDTYLSLHPDKQVETIYLPVDEARAIILEDIKNGPTAKGTYMTLKLGWEIGGHAVWRSGRLSNDLWEEWDPDGLEKVLGRMP